MAATNAEIARDLVVATLSRRDYVDSAEISEMYKTILAAVGDAVRKELEKDGY